MILNHNLKSKDWNNTFMGEKQLDRNCNIASMRVKNPHTSSMFFYRWLDFLRPFHKLTINETKVLAELLYHRYKLSGVITDNRVLDMVVLGRDIKKQILQDTGLGQNNYSVLLSSLKSKGVIVNNIINKKYIPDIKVDCKRYELILSFNIIEDEQEQPEVDKSTE